MPPNRARAPRGSILHRSGRWWVRWSSGGRDDRQQWRTGPYPSSDAARAALDATPSLDPHEAVSLGDWLTVWADSEARRAHMDGRDNHAKRVAQVVRDVAPLLTGRRVGTVRPVDFDGLWRHLLSTPLPRSTRPLGFKTVRNYRSMIVQAMQEAVRQGATQHNAARESRLPTLHRGDQRRTVTPQVAKERVLSVGQVAALSGWLDERLDDDVWALPCLIVVETGLRRGEALGLHWSDVHWVDSTITVECQALLCAGGRVELRPLKTGRSRRTVEIGGFLRDRLSELQRRRRTTATRLLTTIDGKHPANPEAFGKWTARTVRTAGLDLPDGFTLHDLRHTHCSHLLATGVPLPEVSARLGHETPEFTLRRYAHAIPKQSSAVAAWELLRDAHRTDRRVDTGKDADLGGDGGEQGGAGRLRVARPVITQARQRRART